MDMRPRRLWNQRMRPQNAAHHTSSSRRSSQVWVIFLATGPSRNESILKVARDMGVQNHCARKVWKSIPEVSQGAGSGKGCLQERGRLGIRRPNFQACSDFRSDLLGFALGCGTGHPTSLAAELLGSGGCHSPPSWAQRDDSPRLFRETQQKLKHGRPLATQDSAVC